MTKEQIKELSEIVEHQANMETIWAEPVPITEAILQAALRHIHAVLEGDKAAAELYKEIYWHLEDEL